MLIGSSSGGDDGDLIGASGSQVKICHHMITETQSIYHDLGQPTIMVK